jgi:hypothetical protein
MVHHATLTYSTALLHRSVRAFWWRATGWQMRLGVAVLGILVAITWGRGDRSWAVGALGMGFAVAVGMLAMVYFVHRGNSLAKLRDMGAPTAAFTADEGGMRFVSGAGESRLPWSMVQDVWQFDGFWLLLFSKAQFVTLPLADLSPAMQAFVLYKARSAGARVS